MDVFNLNPTVLTYEKLCLKFSNVTVTYVLSMVRSALNVLTFERKLKLKNRENEKNVRRGTPYSRGSPHQFKYRALVKSICSINIINIKSVKTACQFLFPSIEDQMDSKGVVCIELTTILRFLNVYILVEGVTIWATRTSVVQDVQQFEREIIAFEIQFIFRGVSSLPESPYRYTLQQLNKGYTYNLVSTTMWLPSINFTKRQTPKYLSIK
ncbi:hypothetical protein AGLY_013638 [Aphis glycines]|uniref:Uncharacterized protein n=1 Tax=Aphis glycines TaxID=307491 RepID=A0A6G0T783_APHGL|nr:hypothetical protein AGLY_013638 [Aphis glycines]